jgi:hypothetical protein
MGTQSVGLLVTLLKDGPSGIKVQVGAGMPVGPFEHGPPPGISRGQYIGIGEHLVLTLIEDRFLPGLLPFQADCPMTPGGQAVHWVGGCSCQAWQEALYYRIHPLFLRDAQDILAGEHRLDVVATLSYVTGIVTDRPYWLIEIPCLTRAVLLHLDQIVVVRRRKRWRPGEGPIKSKTARSPWWGHGALETQEIWGEAELKKKKR